MNTTPKSSAMAETGQQTIFIIVSGKVQGVYYRQSAKERAIELKINGEIKNMPDGSVTIKVTGTKEQLNDFIQWCRQGPKGAVVTDVKFTEIPLQLFDHFTIIRF
jgi:acylphosphatase